MIRCVRTPGGQRRVPESEILRLCGEDAVPPKPKAVALYARVSSHDRKNKGDLDRQVERLRAGARERKARSRNETLRLMSPGGDSTAKLLFRC